MTILLTDSLGSFDKKEKEFAELLRKESRSDPITTLYKVRTGRSYRLIMKTGRNNFICMQDKIMYRLKHMGSVGMELVAAKDDSISIPVHDFAIQVAILKLK